MLERLQRELAAAAGGDTASRSNTPNTTPNTPRDRPPQPGNRGSNHNSSKGNSLPRYNTTTSNSRHHRGRGPDPHHHQPPPLSPPSQPPPPPPPRRYGHRPNQSQSQSDRLSNQFPSVPNPNPPPNPFQSVQQPPHPPPNPFQSVPLPQPHRQQNPFQSVQQPTQPQQNPSHPAQQPHPRQKQFQQSVQQPGQQPKSNPFQTSGSPRPAHTSAHTSQSSTSFAPQPAPALNTDVPLPRIVVQCLDLLNKSLAPPLPDTQIRQIDLDVKRQQAPSSVDDFETVAGLRPFLAQEIWNAKEQAHEQLQRQKTIQEAPSHPRPPSMISILDKFLQETDRLLSTQDAVQLQNYLQIEPPFNDVYTQLINEVRTAYPRTNEWDYEHPVLEAKVESVVSQTRESEPVGNWAAMSKFLSGWLIFIRDVDVSNLLTTYEALRILLGKANNALTHPTKCVILLPTVIGYAHAFARLAIGLDKRPELVQRLVNLTQGEDSTHESLPEKAANVVRLSMEACINARGPVVKRANPKPEGMKVGIYKLANICLKILFQCEKVEASEQVFTKIINSAAPLSIYPASERVTYLYYLGRYHFIMTHYYAAQIALQEAHDHCYVDRSCLKQRRIILVYLVTANMILGRFPSNGVYNLPEAYGFRERFQPICRAIAKGDLESFRRLTQMNHEHAGWFTRYRIFLQIEDRCETLVRRSLFRKVFILSGDHGDNETRKAATLDLNLVVAAFQYLETRAIRPEGWTSQDKGPGRRHINFAIMNQYPTVPMWGIHPEFSNLGLTPEVNLPDIDFIEGMASSLIYQGYLNGFISHKTKRFAITGAKKKGGPVAAGFPAPWEALKEQTEEVCPGWIKEVKEEAFNPPAAVPRYGPDYIPGVIGEDPEYDADDDSS